MKSLLVYLETFSGENSIHFFLILKIAKQSYLVIIHNAKFIVGVFSKGAFFLRKLQGVLQKNTKKGSKKANQFFRVFFCFFRKTALGNF